MLSSLFLLASLGFGDSDALGLLLFDLALRHPDRIPAVFVAHRLEVDGALLVDLHALRIVIAIRSFACLFVLSQCTAELGLVIRLNGARVGRRSH